MATVGASPVEQAIVSALSKRFSGISINENFSENMVRNFSELLETRSDLSAKDEVLKWVKYSEDFLANSESRPASLKSLNECLRERAALLGGLRVSEADIVVFSSVHSFVSQLSASEIQGIPHVIRWMDYVQNKEDFTGVFKKIEVQKHKFEPHKKAPVEGKADAKKKTKEKEKEKQPAEKDVEINVSVLNIQVGLIRSAQKHPSADSLLVEEIDIGEGNVRQVVSGLAKFCTPESLTNRRVVLITNVKPGKLRDVTSSGLVLCASSEDHTVVEPLLPPDGAAVGERISFAGYEGKPEDVLNPKKKQLDKITPHLFTDGNGIATFKGIPFMTSAGPCTSTISNAAIK